MGIFDYNAVMDWNGDGKIDSWDAGLELAMLSDLMDSLDRKDRIDRIVNAITEKNESCHIGNEEFAALCRQVGLSMDDFEQNDIDEIQRRLDRWSNSIH